MRETILISGAGEGQLDESSFIQPRTIVINKWYDLNHWHFIYDFWDRLESHIPQNLQEYAPLVRSLKKAILERKLTHTIKEIQKVGVRSKAEIIFTGQNFGGGV